MADEDVNTSAAPVVVSPLANPLADDKLSKKLFKVVKKAASAKMLRRGVKEVVKALRKGEKGVCIIAGDISPIDVISHLPVFCEEMNVPYVFVSSKAELGSASNTKRPTSCLLIVPAAGFDSQDKYDEILEKVKSMAPSVTA